MDAFLASITRLLCKWNVAAQVRKYKKPCLVIESAGSRLQTFTLKRPSFQNNEDHKKVYKRVLGDTSMHVSLIGWRDS